MTIHHTITKAIFIGADFHIRRTQFLITSLFFVAAALYFFLFSETYQIGFLLLAYIPVIPTIRYYRTNRLYQAIKNKLDCDYSLNDGKLTMKSTVAESTLTRDTFTQVIPYKNHYLCLTTTRALCILPQNELTDSFINQPA